MQWEYRVVYTDKTSPAVEMNGYGKQGWEAFAVTEDQQATKIYFKRKVK